MEVRSGTVVAGFRIESLVGAGAMGTVYLAEDLETGGRVALKVLVPELARDERFRRRFLRESELAASLEHAHVVETVAAGEKDGVLYLAMAYVEGSDLRRLLQQQGRLEPERAVNLVAEVAAALDTAHALGLVHRDVKPGNILVADRPDGERAYVCDFGLARHVSSVSSLTGDRGFVGTIDYVPPEQIEGGQIDGRADVYSLGCVLYECLAGERPFDRESELSVVFAHLNEPPPRLSEARPELPEAFDAVFATALAKTPDDRYATCGELATAARAALLGKVVTPRGRRRRRLLVAAAVLAALAAAVVGVLATHGGSSPARALRRPPSLPLKPSSLNLIDARTRRVVAAVRYRQPVAVADTEADVHVSGRSAWVLLLAQHRLVRVDLGTRKITATLRLPWPPNLRFAVGGGSVWVAQDCGPNVLRIDEGSARVAGGFTLPGEVICAIAYGARSLWLGVPGPRVLRVDPRNGHVLHRYPVPGSRLEFADGELWAAGNDDGAVSEIDPVEDRVTHRTNLHGWLSDIAVGGGFVWASVTPDGKVFKLRESDLSVQSSLAAGSDPERISFGGGNLWIANSRANSLSSVQPDSGVRREFATDTEPAAVVYHHGLVLASTAPALAPLRPIAGMQLRVSTPTDSATTTEPTSGGLGHEQLLYATCSNLLSYPDATGARGTHLQPEIAAAMPAVSSDGRTYTFRVRSAYRFSPPSNERVTAETFRHTFERALAQENRWSAAPRFASDIVGVAQFRAGKAPRSSGIRARGDTLSLTIARPSGDFLTRISLLWFCPVPSSVPVHTKRYIFTPVPSAGPYYLSSLAGDRAVLLRNPNYPGSRPRRAERIVYTNDIPTPEAIALTDRGALDLLPQDFDNTTLLLVPGGPVDRRSGAASPSAHAGRRQFFGYDAPLLDYIAFNTRRPLFRAARLRRAINYALDRRAVAAAFADAPADQIVSLTVPGFPAGAVYPLRRDLATARRLVGDRRRHAVLFFCGNPGQRKAAQIVRSNLARIRIAVSIVEAQNCPNGEHVAADLLFQSGLESDEPDAAAWLDLALKHGVYYSALGPGPWNDAAFRRRIEQARPLRGQARLRAYARLDRELMRMAPVAVYGTFVWSQYLSPHVGCRLFQPIYGFVDLGALCKPSRP